MLVLYKKNGLAIGPDEGQLVLVSTHDTKVGARHVKRLKSLEVIRL